VGGAGVANAAFPQMSPDLGADRSDAEQGHEPIAESPFAVAPSAPPAAAGQAAHQPPRVAMAGHLMGRRRTVFAAVPIAVIKPNPLQPRQYFDPESLADLASSIKARGLLQPIIVRRGRDGEYTLVAGERRLRAAELAGLRLVPAILSEDDLLEVALEENVQREDLSPLEEAEALASLAQERGHTHAELADVIHKSRPYVSNTLALTRLPADVKEEYFRDGGGVSREILISIARQESPEAMRALWRRVKLQSLSVRAFREQESERPAQPERADELLRATRRFNRALRHADGLESLSAAERQSLRRALERARKGIAATLQRLAADAPLD
jgi:ParB family transcriptional regulator, chromosome partitioning protein